MQTLRQQGVLNPHPEAVTDPLFQTGDFFDSRDLLQAKYEMLRRVEVDKMPVTEAAAVFGLSRPALKRSTDLESRLSSSDRAFCERADTSCPGRWRLSIGWRPANPRVLRVSLARQKLVRSHSSEELFGGFRCWLFSVKITLNNAN
jgi:hypothetical protein